MPPTEPDSRPLAHASVTNGVSHNHSLADHLSEVARLAGDHAALFGGRDWARVAGLWHDLGKYRPRFQRYIRAASAAETENAHIEGKPGRAPHSTAGALLASERFGAPGRLDFPVTYRALVGRDSIPQSAGRCNREGRLYHPELGLLAGQGAPAMPVGNLIV